MISKYIIFFIFFIIMISIITFHNYYISYNYIKRNNYMKYNNYMDDSTSYKNGNDTITIQGNGVEYLSNGQVEDVGKYITENNENFIFFQNQGKRNLHYDSVGSIILSQSFQRYTTQENDINNCNNNYGKCQGNYESDVDACSVYCEDAKCFTDCRNKYIQEIIDCNTDQRVCCSKSYGDLNQDAMSNSFYLCSPSNLSNIKGNVYGIWNSTSNYLEGLKINSSDNSVEYFGTLGGGSEIIGSYKEGNIILNDETYNINYDSNTDIVILSKTFTKI